ncbi:MAG: hypothetical protein ACOH1P_05185 [Lysobacter sp.]
MLRVAIAFALFTSAGLAHAQLAQCGALLAPAIPVQQTVTAPVTAEFSTPSRQLGAPTGVLSQALGESLSVDQVLFRLQVANCATVASIVPAPSPASLPAASEVPVSQPAATTATDATDPATYKPRTEFDNTPWRFDMNQNGQRMTADAFAAWMESKGVRVAKGAAKPATTEAPVAEAVIAEPVQPAKDE